MSHELTSYLDAATKARLEEAVAGHARDESAGFVAQLAAQLEARGYRGAAPLHRGCEALLLRASAPDGRPVAVRAQAPFAMRHWRNRPTLRNFLRLKLLALLAPRHPNLVSYRRCFRLSFRPPGPRRALPIFCLEMEFLPGVPLLKALAMREYLEGGPARLRRLTLGCLRGWSALHRRGLRQGDINPQNILLRPATWDPVLVDLRFSLRFGRDLGRERHEFRCTLRAALTGRWRRDRDLPPLNKDEIGAFWGPWAGSEAARAELDAWAQFSESLAPGAPLGRAAPPELLRAATALAAANPGSGGS